MDAPISLATPADAAEILALQRLAYRSEAERYGDWQIPPLRESLAELQAAFATHVFLKATLDAQLVGAVRGRLEGGTCHVGRLIVRPERQRQGIGTRLLRALEAHCPAAQRFELFTGSLSLANLRLYERLGYRRCRTAPLSPRVTVVYLEKRRNSAAPDAVVTA